MIRAALAGAMSSPTAMAAALTVTLAAASADTFAADASANPAAAAPAAHPVSHVFLVQNSGWMEPFYSDPSSQYKALIAAVVTAAAQPGDALVLASFNQSLPNVPSPKALLAAKVDAASTRKQVNAALAPLTVAHKAGGAALADTDLGEAVRAAIDTALDHRAGLVWLFTNNKNSPNNDQATAQRNREFYQLIHGGGDIVKALAFPLQMPVHGSRYSASGLMVYVFAIHEEGARELDRLLRSGRLQQVITEPPARLKPLDQDTVRLSPVRVANAPGVAFSMTPAGTLRADVLAGAVMPTAKIQWTLENSIYPYTIASAQLAARSVLAGEDRPINLGATSVTGLAPVPGKGQPLSSEMQLPVAQLPGRWSMAALKSAGSAYVLPGTIEVRLSEQKLELSQAFRVRMAALFPGDPLPDIFTPPAQIQGSRAVLPIEVRVSFGIAPLLALVGGALALAVAALASWMALNRPRKILVTVESELRTMHVRPGSRQPLYDKAGLKVAELKTTLFGSTLTDLRDGAQVRLGR